MNRIILGDCIKHMETLANKSIDMILTDPPYGTTACKWDTVLDFTMGSGTTGVACKQLNRDFIGIELDKDYFKIAEDRINKTVRQMDLFRED